MSSAVGVLIRDATPPDARAIAEVHVASWRWAYRDDLPAEFLEGLSVDDRERQWSERLAGGGPGAGVVVAEDGDRIVGFCSFGPSHDEDIVTGTGEVSAIYFLPTAMGRGNGRASLAAAVERLRALGYDRATLWVMASNARTRRFYEAAGWSWDGTVSEHRFDCGNVPIVRYAVDL